MIITYKIVEKLLTCRSETDLPWIERVKSDLSLHVELKLLYYYCIVLPKTKPDCFGKICMLFIIITKRYIVTVGEYCRRHKKVSR